MTLSYKLLLFILSIFLFGLQVILSGKVLDRRFQNFKSFISNKLANLFKRIMFLKFF